MCGVWAGVVQYVQLNLLKELVKVQERCLVEPVMCVCDVCMCVRVCVCVCVCVREELTSKNQASR